MGLPIKVESLELEYETQLALSSRSTGEPRKRDECKHIPVNPQKNRNYQFRQYGWTVFREGEIPLVENGIAGDSDTIIGRAIIVETTHTRDETSTKVTEGLYTITHLEDN